MLGRILPEFFPNIFGPNEDQPLDSDAARQALEDLAQQINEGSPGQPAKSVDEVMSSENPAGVHVMSFALFHAPRRQGSREDHQVAKIYS